MNIHQELINRRKIATDMDDKDELEFLDALEKEFMRWYHAGVKDARDGVIKMPKQEAET